MWWEEREKVNTRISWSEIQPDGWGRRVGTNLDSIYGVYGQVLRSMEAKVIGVALRIAAV